MKVTVAKEAGFCFGVKRATDFVEKELSGNAEVYILGHLIHNRIYNEQLAARGAKVIGIDDVEAIAKQGREARVIIKLPTKTRVRIPRSPWSATPCTPRCSRF